MVSEDVKRWGNENPPTKDQVEFDDKELEQKLIDIANHFRYIDERVFGKQIKVWQVFGNFEMPKGKTRSFVSVDISDKSNFDTDVSKRDIDTIQDVLGDEYEFQSVDSYFTKDKNELKSTVSFMKKEIVIMEENDDDYKKRVNDEIRLVEKANETVDNQETILIVEEQNQCVVCDRRISDREIQDSVCKGCGNPICDYCFEEHSADCICGVR